MTAITHSETNVESNVTKVAGDTAAPYAHIVQSQQQEQSSLPLKNPAASNVPEQGFLTMTSPFEAASNQPHSSFLNSVESSAGRLLTSAESSGSEFLHGQGNMWQRVAAGQGSVKDDAMAGLEFIAGASLAIAGGAELAGVIGTVGAAGLDGIGSMGILGYNPLTAGLVPFTLPIVFPASF
jgi:hypothetical protein